MKTMYFLILNISLYASIISTAFSQSEITGLVRDADGKGLSYANIGIKNGKTGTVSAIDGKFSISIPNSLLNDSITFSSIGFKDKVYLINSLVTKKSVEIVLDEMITTLAPVKITNAKLKRYKLGITGRTPLVSIPVKSNDEKDVLEQARLISIKRPSKLINANIFIISESMKNVAIRLNFYTIKNGMPGKRIVEKSIVKNAIIKNGWFRIDLSSEGIYLDEDFVISFEYLPSEQKSIVFGAKIGAADSFLRSSSQGVWEKNQLGGCSIYVTAEM